MSQQTIAFIIVGIAALAVVLNFFRTTLAAPIARFFLKRGSVKWAMRLKAQAKEPGCGDCGPAKSGPSCHR